MTPSDHHNDDDDANNESDPQAPDQESEDSTFPQSSGNDDSNGDHNSRKHIHRYTNEGASPEDASLPHSRRSNPRRRRVSECEEDKRQLNVKKPRGRSSALADHEKLLIPGIDHSMQILGGGYMQVQGLDKLVKNTPYNLLSLRSSCASSDNDELDGVREALRQRRLSRQTSIIQRNNMGESYPGLKVLKLAIQEHELPVRMAYKQLDELAANAERVKASIEKNRYLLLLQVKKHNSRYTRSAFTGWRLYTEWKVCKKNMLQRVKMLLAQGLVARVFKSWCLHLLRNRKYRRFQTSVEKLLRRRLLQRLWKAWMDFVRKRAQKEQDHRREKRILKDMNDKLKEQLERKVQVIMKRKRLGRAFFALREGCQLVNARQQYTRDKCHSMSQKRISLIFNLWRGIKNLQLFHRRAVTKITNKRLSLYFKAWRDKDFHIETCTRKVLRRRLALVFAAWKDRLMQSQRRKYMIAKINKKRLLWYFNGFRYGCQERKWKKNFRRQVMKKAVNNKLKMAFQAWFYFMQIQDQKKMSKLQEYVAVIEKENQRSKSECDRLARIVESGEWGRQQFAEILQAKEVLVGEREALATLIGRLHQQQRDVSEQAQKNEDKMREFKDQMLGNNFIHHNKMMIKGASSFNSVVRALRNDAIKKGIDPDFFYAIDHLAMDKVSIFPDGEIRVNTLNAFDKGRWIHRHLNSSIDHPRNAKASCISPIVTQGPAQTTSPTKIQLM